MISATESYLGQLSPSHVEAISKKTKNVKAAPCYDARGDDEGTMFWCENTEILGLVRDWSKIFPGLVLNGKKVINILI